MLSPCFRQRFSLHVSFRIWHLKRRNSTHIALKLEGRVLLFKAWVLLSWGDYLSALCIVCVCARVGARLCGCTYIFGNLPPFYFLINHSHNGFKIMLQNKRNGVFTIPGEQQQYTESQRIQYIEHKTHIAKIWELYFCIDNKTTVLVQVTRHRQECVYGRSPWV